MREETPGGGFGGFGPSPPQEAKAEVEEMDATIGWLGGGDGSTTGGGGHPGVYFPPPPHHPTPQPQLWVHSGFFLARPGSFAWILGGGEEERGEILGVGRGER